MYQRWPSDYVKTRFKNVTVNHFVHTQKQNITPEFIHASRVICYRCALHIRIIYH